MESIYKKKQGMRTIVLDESSSQFRGVASVGAVGAFAPTAFEDCCIYSYEVLEFDLKESKIWTQK